MPRANPRFTATAIRRTLREFSAHSVDSECVAATNFVPTTELTGDLTIEFVKRGTYTYEDFPVDEWLLFNNSSSRGTYFNIYIKGNYPHQRVA